MKGGTDAQYKYFRDEVLASSTLGRARGVGGKGSENTCGSFLTKRKHVRRTAQDGTNAQQVDRRFGSTPRNIMKDF